MESLAYEPNDHARLSLPAVISCGEMNVAPQKQQKFPRYFIGMNFWQKEHFPPSAIRA
jgi:hypothetical protein